MQQNIEHPENEACYEGLAVNKGIEQPDPVNPAIAERLKHLRKKTLTADEYVAGILRGDINILSQAITLVESARIDHQAMAQEVINRCLPNTGKSVRTRSREKYFHRGFREIPHRTRTQNCRASHRPE